MKSAKHQSGGIIMQSGNEAWRVWRGGSASVMAYRNIAQPWQYLGYAMAV